MTKFIGVAGLLLWITVGFCSKASIRSSEDLKDALGFTALEQDGCVRLLHSSGTIGCASHKSGTLYLYSGELTLKGLSVLVTDESMLNSLLELVLSKPKDVQKLVSGVLVIRNASAHSSNLDSEFPQAEFGLYPSKTKAWNPRGRDQLRANIPFSVQYVQTDVQDRVLQSAKSNRGKEIANDLHEADLDTEMQGVESSIRCLAEGKCDPLGGYSVLSWMPQQMDKGTRLATTLVLAQLDGIGLMHDSITGADTPLSGLVAMLAAAEAVASGGLQGQWSRRIAFAGLAGEPWGYMGSKKLLWEFHQQSESVSGLPFESIDEIVEMGSVGRLQRSDNGSYEIFMHSQRADEGFGNTSALQDGFRTAVLLTPNLKVSKASSTNPGLPPSSVASFLRVNRTIAGLSLQEFDTEFTNPHYATPNDRLEVLDPEGLAASATLLAQYLSKQALGKSLSVEAVQAILPRVKSLLECVAKAGSLFHCPIADSIITRVGMRSNYVGVLHSTTSDQQDPNVNVKSDMARFVWNFLANVTSSGAAHTQQGNATGCEPYSNPCQQDSICVGFKVSEGISSQNGQCEFAAARFVESISTRIHCKDCNGQNWDQWKPSSAAESWESQYNWPVDAIWTESRWQAGIPSYELYQMESARTRTRVLVAGFTVSLIAIIASFAGKRADLSRINIMWASRLWS